MRIVQTFWTAHQDPLRHGFGWPHAEYNLMSWALSCLSLRQHYDEVVLYTDSAGFHLLIETLRLPYSEVHVVYDSLECLPIHWAMAKLKTYSQQTEPFIHVDGDIYLPQPFKKKIFKAQLVAQNREIGTIYYRKMLDHILSHKEIKIPHFVEKAIKHKNVASYNMGVFGGTDLDFIKRYCERAFLFLKENDMNNPMCGHSNVGCNIFFEQIFFAVMADQEKRKVASVLGHSVKDKGYSDRDFCDLLNYNQKDLFHILGGHKQRAQICNALERTVLAKYPAFYLKIMSLFPTIHARLVDKNEKEKEQILSVEKCMAQYEDFLIKQLENWRILPFEELFKTEQKIANYHSFIEAEKEKQENAVIRRNPHLSFFKFPQTWHPRAIYLIGERLKTDMSQSYHEIAVRPTLYSEGLKDYAIGDLAHNILFLLSKKEHTLRELREQLNKCFQLPTYDANQIDDMINNEITYLLHHGLILYHKNIV